jgi:hypothetical protein
MFPVWFAKDGKNVLNGSQVFRQVDETLTLGVVEDME